MVLEAEEDPTVPARAGDGAGDGGQRLVGPPLPFEPVGGDGDDLFDALPFAQKARTGDGAVAIGADLIVTANLKDFVPLPDGLRAIGPDAFLYERFLAMPEAVLGALGRQAAGYRNPPAGRAELLDWLERDVPDFVAAVRAQEIVGGA